VYVICSTSLQNELPSTSWDTFEQPRFASAAGSTRAQPVDAAEASTAAMGAADFMISVVVVVVSAFLSQQKECNVDE